MSDSTSYRLIAIAAMASNRVIGKDGDLPWSLPADLKLFKERTLGHPIIMGRKTCASLKKPLPKRRNIVMSRSLHQVPVGFETISSLDELGSKNIEGDLFVIGGAQIYELLLPKCEELFLTYIYNPYDGDTTLPDFEHLFSDAEVLNKFDEFELRRYTRKTSMPLSLA